MILVHKKIGYYKVAILRFFTQGLTQDYGQKLQISSLFVCFFFGKISLEIMSDDHLVKNQALSQSKVLAI